MGAATKEVDPNLAISVSVPAHFISKAGVILPL